MSEAPGESMQGAGSADEFQALEAKVMRAVEVLRQEREARAAAEGEVHRLRGELEATRREHAAAEERSAGELESLRGEREEVRRRVERMLSQMDELL